MGGLNGSFDNLPQGSDSLDYDVLIIGEGLVGIYTLMPMSKLGLRARVIERGSGVGGVCQSEPTVYISTTISAPPPTMDDN
ncbi:hypothetical protein BGW36DRAFT_428093 [Talaromyces proteolyticus]|uniref:Uncharacterized protein n=1 Tax=Talaromyces proteolyticus TaxID=1131652 RepID=A0AAD4KNP8_9EURO|nr:uncharacterized protein BGW36DRAFT_428093 [Talaromyces proteolyticus]KAH8696069.1 hypothetical protein BGW36DRAFT_428093 [Talaromyces proteolyticus]